MATADGREQHLRRLWTTDGGRARLVRVVREWLGIDGIAELDKDSNVYPQFSTHHDAMTAESISFIDEVLQQRRRHAAGAAGRGVDVSSTRSTAPPPSEISAYYTDYYGLASIGTDLSSQSARRRRGRHPRRDPEPGGVSVAVRDRHRVAPRPARRRGDAPAGVPRSARPRRARHQRRPARPRSEHAEDHARALRRARHRPALQDLSPDASTTSASRSSCTTAWAPSAPTARRPSRRPPAP